MLNGLLPSGSSNGQAHEPESSAEAERGLLAPPMTLGYKSQTPVWNWDDFSTGMAASQMHWDIESMLLHPHVVQSYNYYKSAIAHAQFQVAANSPEVKRYIELMIQRFWTRSLDQAQLKYDYGWCGYEVVYGRESGYLTYQHLHDFNPFDAWVVTKKHRYFGINVQNIPGSRGKAHLWGPGRWPAKGFWLTHNRRWNRWYGRTQLYGAWKPWRRLAHRDGIEEVVDGAWYRQGYYGPEVRYPPNKRMRTHGGSGGAEDCDESGQHSARFKAQEIMENAKAGIGVALPNTVNEKGVKEWEIIWNNQTIQLNGLLDVAKYLQDQISYGIGVPPELLQAAEVGSGWSGRMIPMLGFYTGQLKEARSIVWAWSQQIGIPLVRWNFGPKAKFEINVTLKVPDELTNMGGQQPQGQPGQPPPQSGQAPAQPPVAAGAAPQQWHREPGPKPQGQQGGQQPIQFSALPFDLDPEPETPPAPRPLHWGRIVSEEAAHLMIVGPTSSGKTIIAEAIAANLPGKIFVIDPVYEPNSWGGLPAATVSLDGNFAPIQMALNGLSAEMRARQAKLQGGQHDFERLTILWDEVPNTIAELPDAGGFIRRIANFGRHVNMHLIGIGQSSRVGSWGLEGFGDASENFARILLGNKALEVMPELTGTVERPAVLEWQGTRQALDLTPVLKMAQQKLDPSRAFTLPPAPVAVPEPAPALIAEPMQLSTYDATREIVRALLLDQPTATPQPIMLSLPPVTVDIAEQHHHHHLTLPAPPPTTVNIESPKPQPITVQLPAAPAPVVQYTPPAHEPAQVHVHNEVIVPQGPPPVTNVLVAAPTVNVAAPTVNVPEQKLVDLVIERGRDGLTKRVTEEFKKDD